jgi:acyl carrier protein
MPVRSQKTDSGRCNKKDENFKEEPLMIFEKVKDILVDQLDAEEEKVTLEASIVDDLGADSLDLVDLVMSLEEEFDVEIPDEAVENIKTVGDIVKYIEDNA